MPPRLRARGVKRRFKLQYYNKEPRSSRKAKFLNNRRRTRI